MGAWSEWSAARRFSWGKNFLELGSVRVTSDDLGLVRKPRKGCRRLKTLRSARGFHAIGRCSEILMKKLPLDVVSYRYLALFGRHEALSFCVLPQGNAKTTKNGLMDDGFMD